MNDSLERIESRAIHQRQITERRERTKADRDQTPVENLFTASKRLTIELDRMSHPFEFREERQALKERRLI